MTINLPFIKIDDSALDLLARRIPNEIINGFRVPSFEETIGVSDQEFKAMYIALRARPDGTGIGFDPGQARIFRNALAAVLEELGIEEFQTRTGHDFEEGTAILQTLSSFIDMHGVGRD